VHSALTTHVIVSGRSTNRMPKQEISFQSRAH
jgi:hypothetical protein